MKGLMKRLLSMMPGWCGLARDGSKYVICRATGASVFF
jgi:hypothetical protein